MKPGFPCARGFDSGIEGQQVGLIRYVGDDDHNIVNGLRVGVELFHIFFQGCADLIYILDAVHHFFYDMGAGFGLFLGFRRRLGGRRGVGGNFADGSVHLTDGGRGIAQAGGGFLGGLIRSASCEDADAMTSLMEARRSAMEIMAALLLCACFCASSARATASSALAVC